MKEIVLIGGGHAHVQVMSAFARDPLPGARLTLISPELSTPYSGMLPGVIAGLYRPEEAHIDLLRLAAATDTQLIIGEATGIDRAAKRVRLRDREVPYDITSLNVGITPDLRGIDGAEHHGLTVKPIGDFLGKLATLLKQNPRRIVMIGGGAGGVEVMLSLRGRIGEGEFALVTAETVLAGHNARVRQAFRRLLQEADIALHEHNPARRVTGEGVLLADGTHIPADAVLVATGAAAPDWLKETGLVLDEAGCVMLRPTLQTLSDDDVFAAGDCAHLSEPRPKAGVFAVRAGRMLARNLRLHASGAKPEAWRPQRHHLAVISAGRRYAIASRGAFMLEGAALWWIKDWIDRRWLKPYQEPGL